MRNPINAILNREKLKAIPGNQKRSQDHPLFPLLFSTVLEALDGAIRQEKEMKKIKK